ncbi:MAG: Fe-S cluster assembly protein SufD [Gemmatimonadales bacterium]
MNEVVDAILNAVGVIGSSGKAAQTAVEAYRFDFEEADKGSHEPRWLREMRRSAMGEFERVGIPTMKDEDWHFTNVAPIGEKLFGPPRRGAPVPSEVISRFQLAQDWHTVLFVNGGLVKDSGISTAGGISITSLASEIASDSEVVRDHFARLATPESASFTALNTAFAKDGAVVRIGANAAPDKPIHLLFISDTGSEYAAVQTHNLVLAECHSQGTIIESYVTLGGDSYFTNAVTEVYLGDGARLGHYKLQTESRNAFHVGTIQVQQERNSRYESFSFATGSRLSRTNVYTTLAGDAAEAVLNGLYMVDGSQHVDHQTRIEHVAPNCPSHELYKGILDGASHGVFNGKVYVHPEAQKTDGKQSNNNLLLSDGARVDTKPQLEIFADDVKCTHGATVGRLDETALFYMRSRGIGPAQAKRLLTYAFAADVLEKIELDGLKEALEAQVLERFTS